MTETVIPGPRAPEIQLVVRHHPMSAACSRGDWQEQCRSQSEDMQDALRGRAVAHAKATGHDVIITVKSVMTIHPETSVR